MKTQFTIAVLALSAIATSAAAAPKVRFKGDELAGRAHIGLKAARAIALRARHGVIIGQELENEKGGSGLRYSFDIRVAGKIYEVGIDARNGALLENAAEGKNPD